MRFLCRSEHQLYLPGDYASPPAGDEMLPQPQPTNDDDDDDDYRKWMSPPPLRGSFYLLERCNGLPLHYLCGGRVHSRGNDALR